MPCRISPSGYDVPKLVLPPMAVSMTALPQSKFDIEAGPAPGTAPPSGDPPPGVPASIPASSSPTLPPVPPDPPSPAVPPVSVVPPEPVVPPVPPVVLVVELPAWPPVFVPTLPWSSEQLAVTSKNRLTNFVTLMASSRGSVPVYRDPASSNKGLEVCIRDHKTAASRQLA